MKNLSNKVKNIKELMPLIISFGNKNLKDKHWLEIFKVCGKGQELMEQGSFSLNDLLRFDIDKNLK